jgi:lysophospholipase L1-like esterase
MGGHSEGSSGHVRGRGRTLRKPNAFRQSAAALLLGLIVSSCNAGAAAPVSTPDPSTADGEEGRTALTLDRPADLAAFFRALDRLEQHQGGPVHIVQLGDSHTAGDVMTGRLRQLFQERFGDGGRGMMAVGLPYNGVRQVEVHITQTGKWDYHNSLTHPDDGPYGISAFKATSRAAGASLTLEAIDPAGFDHVEIEVLHHANGGFLDIEVDGIRQRRLLTNGSLRLNRVSIDVPPHSHQLRLIAVDRRSVELLSWSIERRGPGIVFDSLGVSSATIGLPAHWTPEFVIEELRHLNPALVILAYGTNEAFQADFDPLKYGQTVSDTLALVRRGAPGASILIVGPPDAQRLTSACRQGNGAEARCLVHPDPNRAYSCEWETPGPLVVVRSIEQRLAQRDGAVFWDWSAIMGGACAMDRWVTSDPPLARGDHVHMTLAGYDRTADALFHDLMEAYAAHREAEAHRPPAAARRPRP